jgi:hypothetical protein
MLPHLPRQAEGGTMTNADRTAYELAELVCGERPESDISDADGFLRLAAAIEAAPREVATETARWIRQMVAEARGDAGLCPGCGGPSPGRIRCPCGLGPYRAWPHP